MVFVLKSNERHQPLRTRDIVPHNLRFVGSPAGIRTIAKAIIYTYTSPNTSCFSATTSSCGFSSGIHGFSDELLRCVAFDSGLMIWAIRRWFSP